jgi:hypothetical protein
MDKDKLEDILKKIIAMQVNKTLIKNSINAKLPRNKKHNSDQITLKEQ